MNRISKYRTNKIGSRSLYLGSVIAILIAISPYIFYSYQSFPDTPTFSTPFFDITSQFNRSIYFMMWIILNKFVPLYLFTIWFFTCRHWWYHVILIPISMYVFQLMGALNDDFIFVDDFQLYYTIPVMMIVIPVVYLIRVKIFDKVVYGINLQEIEEELKKYEQKDESAI